jgi:hypothetical protein
MPSSLLLCVRSERLRSLNGTPAFTRMRAPSPTARRHSLGTSGASVYASLPDLCSAAGFGRPRVFWS